MTPDKINILSVIKEFRSFILILLLLCFSVTDAQIPSRGSVFITGHDPDFHATELRRNPIGARNILRIGLAFVLSGSDKPFLVLQTNGFGGVPKIPQGHADPIRGLIAAGFMPGSDFVQTDIPGFLAADLGDFGAIFVPSDFGGLLTQQELDALISRRDEIIAYVNRGGGLMALAESSDGASNITRDFFGFLPFVVRSNPKTQSEAGNTLTDFGRSLGLTKSDINGNFSHTVFPNVGGMNVVDFDRNGDILSAAFRGQIDTSGVIRQVNIDIKPQVCPNLVKAGSEEILPVAILGDSDLDVHAINASSVQLEGISPLAHTISDVAKPLTRSDTCDCTIERPDGIDDLLPEFNVRSLLAARGNVSTGMNLALNLIGQLKDSTRINGFDCIVLDSLACEAKITSPQDLGAVCTDKIAVEGVIRTMGGIPPFTITCEVNGITANVQDTTFMATVPVTTGEDRLIATCTVTDSFGPTVVCRDTIRVQALSDKIAPTSTFTPGYKSVTGTIFDDESGVAKIEPIFLFNAKLTVDTFVPGAKKVNFRVDDLGLESYLGFDIKITDLCGNTHICDPVLSYLSSDGAARQYTFKFRSVDRYLILQNHGLLEIRVDLNGHLFNLSTTSNRNVRNRNTYVIPEEGSITIDLKPYLLEGENVVRLEIEGRPGTGANFTLIDATHVIDHTLELQPIPTAFQLSQNYPNPFSSEARSRLAGNPSTTIRFGIPAQLAEGTAVQLRIYNALGELVRTLVDEKMFPGQYAVEWDGRNNRGEVVSAGMYIYQLFSGEFKTTKRMLFLK
jgi:hypothetical protein